MTSPKPTTTTTTTPANPHKHIHVTHLIALLSTALQGFYNPMNRKLKDEDREMHLRIMNELDRWSLRPDPAEERSRSQSIYSPGEAAMAAGEPPGSSSSPNAKSVSRKSSFLSGMNRKRDMITPPPMPTPGGTPSFASSSASLISDASSLDTPSSLSAGERSPSRGSSVGGQAGKVQGGGGRGGTRSEVNLIDVVRRVFGVDVDRLNHDLDGLKRAGLDEKVG